MSNTGSLPTDKLWLLKRLLRALCLCMTSIFVLFLLLQLLPGDAASNQAGKGGAQAVAKLQAQMGLDEPVLTRFWHWFSNFLTGNLGQTLFTGRSVQEVIATPFLSSLTVGALVLIGITIITIPATLHFYSRPTKVGAALETLAIALASLPEFVLGLLLLVLFALKLHLLPVLSQPAPGHSVWSEPKVLVLPALTLWTLLSVTLFRRIGALVATHAQAPYIRECYLAGISHAKVLTRHLLPSILPGIGQLMAQGIPYLLGGSVIVDTVFSFPGIGYVLVQSLYARETTTVMSISAILIIVASLSYVVADFLQKRQQSVTAVL